MKHLTFPFSDNCTIEISNGRVKRHIDCELASSEIEIFQSLSYRKCIDIPLVLLFKNPLKQNFSKQQFKFNVEQICVDNKNNYVTKINILYPSQSRGEFIQSYSEYALIILSPIGFFQKDLLIENKTKIKVISKFK